MARTRGRVTVDEPAAGLRYLEKQELATLLRQLRAEGITVLLVEHDMDFVMGLTDRLVVMDFGEKLAEGLPAEIQRNAAVLEAYLEGLDPVVVQPAQFSFVRRGRETPSSSH